PPDHALEGAGGPDPLRAEVETGRLLEPSGELVERLEAGLGEEGLPGPPRKQLEEEVARVQAPVQVGPRAGEVALFEGQAGPEELDPPVELEERRAQDRPACT